MAIEINLPDIGSDEVEVTEIMVRVGDKVEAEQSLITVEGNKASMEIPAPFAGIVKKINIHLGDKISTGSLLMLFETIQKSDSRELQQSAQLQSNGSKEINLPDIGSDEVEVTEIMVRVGDKVEAEQSLITVEGNKASMEIPAPFSGTVKDIKIAVGDKIITNSLIMILNVENKLQLTSVANNTTTISNQQQIEEVPISSSQLNNHCFMSTIQSKNNKDEFVENNAYIHATPVIRRLARQFGVNLAQVKGNGRKGRILYEDIQTYVKESMKRTELMSDSVLSYLSRILIWPQVNFAKFGNIEEIEISRIQKISGSNLHRNWMMIPQVTQFDEADITELEAFRKQQNADAEKKKRDVKITMLVFIMKAVAKALEELPRFNSSLSADAQTLTLKKYINIGVAVDTPTSLVVPVVNNANKKGIIELSCELLELSKKARDGKLTSADMQGGCFSISSLGGIGGTAFTPIVNAPEVAILGIAKSSIKPVWNGKEFAPRLMLPLSLSYDHRVINGADGVRFINFITYILSDIRHLIL